MRDVGCVAEASREHFHLGMVACYLESRVRPVVCEYKWYQAGCWDRDQRGQYKQNHSVPVPHPPSLSADYFDLITLYTLRAPETFGGNADATAAWAFPMITHVLAEYLCCEVVSKQAVHGLGWKEQLEGSSYTAGPAYGQH